MKNINAQTLNTTTEITEEKAMTIVNLTQHNATNDQIDAGVFNVDYDHNELDYLRSLLTFDSIPTIEDMQQRVHKFNSELENLLLSSAEVDSIRKKMMQSNQLSLQLAQQGAAKRPDTQKIIQLQQEIEQNQQQISHLTQNAQAKISQAANMS